MYPNPFSNTLNIRSNDLDLNDYTITITSINGAEIFKNHYKSNNQITSIDLSWLNLGCYIITWSTAKTVQHQSILKSN